MRPWILYSVLRVGLFLVLFGVIYALTAQVWSFAWVIAAVAAALLSFCISYIFFGRLRTRVAEEFAARRPREARAGSDEATEDTVVDRDA